MFKLTLITLAVCAGTFAQAVETQQLLSNQSFSDWSGPTFPPDSDEDGK